MSKKKKLIKQNRFSFLKKSRVLIALVFILGVGGIGLYKLNSSSAATPCISRRFVKGAPKSACVADIQGLFNYHNIIEGYGSKPLVVDGVFGSNTANAILIVHVKDNIKPYDSVVGPRIWDTLCGQALYASGNLQWAKLYAIHAGCIPPTN